MTLLLLLQCNIIHSICYVSHFIIFRESLFKSEQGFPIQCTFFLIHGNLLSYGILVRFIIESTVHFFLKHLSPRYFVVLRRCDFWSYRRDRFILQSGFFCVRSFSWKSSRIVEKPLNTESNDVEINTGSRWTEKRPNFWYDVDSMTAALILLGVPFTHSRVYPGWCRMRSQRTR